MFATQSLSYSFQQSEYHLTPTGSTPGQLGIGTPPAHSARPPRSHASYIPRSQLSIYLSSHKLPYVSLTQRTATKKGYTQARKNPSSTNLKDLFAPTRGSPWNCHTFSDLLFCGNSGLCCGAWYNRLSITKLAAVPANARTHNTHHTSQFTTR